jgi:hypothetical protein
MMQLSESELRNLLKIKKKSGNTLYGACPKCGHNEFGISVREPHLFGCFRKKMCGFSGNIFSLFKFLKIPFKKEFRGSFQELELEENALEQKFFEEENKVFQEIKMPMGFKRLKQFNYLDERGYKEQDYENYVCGKTILDKKFKDRIIIGFKQDNRTVAYTGRTLIEDLKPKYRNSSGEMFSLFLDGIEESDYNEATIVEGHFDRINVRNKFEKLGIKSRVVCSFGAKISTTQINLLEREGIVDVNLFFDPDVLKIIEKNAARMLHRFNSLKIMLLDNVEQDPGDSGENDIEKAYLNRKNFIKFTTNKLQIVQL